MAQRLLKQLRGTETVPDPLLSVARHPEPSLRASSPRTERMRTGTISPRAPSLRPEDHLDVILRGALHLPASGPSPIPRPTSVLPTCLPRYLSASLHPPPEGAPPAASSPRPARRRASPRFRSPPGGNTGTREGSSTASPGSARSVSSKSSRVSPGKPAITSAPRRIPGTRRAEPVSHDKLAVYGRRIRRSTGSEPLCIGTWRCGQILPSPASRSTRRGVISSGSTEPRRNRQREVAEAAPPPGSRGRPSPRGRPRTVPHGSR